MKHIALGAEKLQSLARKATSSGLQDCSGENRKNVPEWSEGQGANMVRRSLVGKATQADLYVSSKQFFSVFARGVSG